MLSIGLMSGTSMDGIDASLLRTDGNILIEERGFESLRYDQEFRILLKAAEYSVRSHSGDLIEAKNFYQKNIENYLVNELKMLPISISEKMKELSRYFHGNENELVTFDQVVERSTRLHAQVVNQLLKKNNFKPEQIDVIGYHGQTLFHRPSVKITIQVGDGNLLAELTKITVVNDFRSRDVKSGGQGAPFAPLYHQALAVRDNTFPVAVVNCGGIANITVITGKTTHDVIGFDTGPGNGLVDRYIKQRTQGKEFMDVNGKYGSKGRVDEKVLHLLHEKSIIVDGNNYFKVTPPKSLDIGNLKLIPELDDLSLEDACATLEAFTADTIINSVEYFKDKSPKYWVLAGGGWNNPVIFRELKERLEKKLGPDIRVMNADEAGWNSQTMEAQIFAYLAVRSLQGVPISVPGTTRVPEPLSGGHAYLPPTGGTEAVNKLLQLNPAVLSGYEINAGLHKAFT